MAPWPDDPSARDSGRSASSYDPTRLVTILTATSPVPSHPSTRLIQRAAESLANYAELAGCRHLVICDGCPPQLSHYTEQYQAYKLRLRTQVAAKLFPTSAEILELPHPVGLPGVIIQGCERITTPYVLVFEHDFEVIRSIDVRGILQTFAQSKAVQHIRLNKRANREAGFDFVLKPDVERRPVPLVRTSAWSANPHFAKMSYYREMVLPNITARPGGGAPGFEEPLFAMLCADIRKVGFDRAQRKWGVFLYGDLDAPATIVHLDGRWRID